MRFIETSPFDSKYLWYLVVCRSWKWYRYKTSFHYTAKTVPFQLWDYGFIMCWYKTDYACCFFGGGKSNPQDSPFSVQGKRETAQLLRKEEGLLHFCNCLSGPDSVQEGRKKGAHSWRPGKSAVQCVKDSFQAFKKVELFMECHAGKDAKKAGCLEPATEEILGYKLFVVDGKIVSQEEVPALPLLSLSIWAKLTGWNLTDFL